MKDIYYWADEIKSKNPDKNKDPIVYFSDLKYSGDQWSYLTGDNQDQGDILAVEDGFDNGFGYNVTFWTVNNNPNQEVKINFVYPGSPAAEAGLERGRLRQPFPLGFHSRSTHRRSIAKHHWGCTISPLQINRN